MKRETPQQTELTKAQSEIVSSKPSESETQTTNEKKIADQESDLS